MADAVQQLTAEYYRSIEEVLEADLPDVERLNAWYAISPSPLMRADSRRALVTRLPELVLFRGFEDASTHVAAVALVATVHNRAFIRDICCETDTRVSTVAPLVGRLTGNMDGDLRMRYIDVMSPFDDATERAFLLEGFSKGAIGRLHYIAPPGEPADA